MTFPDRNRQGPQKKMTGSGNPLKKADCGLDQKKNRGSERGGNHYYQDNSLFCKTGFQTDQQEQDNDVYLSLFDHGDDVDPRTVFYAGSQY
jgi:hypothetical protein